MRWLRSRQPEPAVAALVDGAQALMLANGHETVHQELPALSDAGDDPSPWRGHRGPVPMRAGAPSRVMAHTATKPDKRQQFRDRDPVELCCRKAMSLPSSHLGTPRAEIIALIEGPG